VKLGKKHRSLAISNEIVAVHPIRGVDMLFVEVVTAVFKDGITVFFAVQRVWESWLWSRDFGGGVYLLVSKDFWIISENKGHSQHGLCVNFFVQDVRATSIPWSRHWKRIEKQIKTGM
jgi:hypothetical protein